MKKELFFAIGAGLILGLIIAFGIWRVNKTVTSSDQQQTSNIEVTPSPTTSFSITMANVEDLDVVTKTPFLINGITKPNSKVTISTEEKDYILDSQKDGSFEKEIELIAGLNEIVIKAFDQNGDSAETKLKVVYSSEFSKYMEEKVSNEEEETATDEAESIVKKVEEKVSNVLKNPKAYVGTITDISESTYQIKNEEGEIQQISFNEETSFVKIDKTSKAITSSDVAIGDSIIAMGLKNGNQVLEGKRILVTDSPEESLRDIYFTKITDFGKNQITANKIGGQEEIVFTVDSNTDYILIKDGKSSVTKLSNLEEDDIVYVFGISGEKSFEARTIYKIESTQTPAPSESANPEVEEVIQPSE